MGRKIFISYKYADDDVYNITDSSNGCTVRDYVDKIEDTIDSSDHVYKGESDGEDLSLLSDETIWEKLKNRIYDSTLTIIMISKNMRDALKADKDQWIPREISYSLKEVSRVNSSGQSVTSKTNAVLAVVIPDQSGSYTYYTYDKGCCPSKCRVLLTYKIFDIINKNMFNLKNSETNDCNDGSKVYYGDSSYLSFAP
ncbi:TIR domain-containing protein [Desulfosporosinus sp. FKB]|uniref:TIR domain-containing protein n=1 Tax=Desulfosporosinus sp. FKB TaxID=1969835 RepID=UPI000B49B4D6|nr:TIR domain-containing protein [Desulfosporosinus sp. FKB]